MCQVVGLVELVGGRWVVGARMENVPAIVCSTRRFDAVMRVLSFFIRPQNGSSSTTSSGQLHPDTIFVVVLSGVFAAQLCNQLTPYARHASLLMVMVAIIPALPSCHVALSLGLMRSTRCPSTEPARQRRMPIQDIQTTRRLQWLRRAIV